MVWTNFTITKSILSIALEQAETIQVNKISKINLAIGELSGIMAQHCQFESIERR